MRVLEFITGHVIYNPAYTYKFQLKTILEYMGKVAPDIAPQIAFLKKFHKFLLGIFHNLQKDKDMWCLVGMVHGDSKIDNFMFKKV